MKSINRFYKNEFPTNDDLVIVRVINENDYGYNVTLLEYNNIEGLLASSELVKKKYVKKHLLKIGDVLPLIVLKVDENKSTVDLSKKRVTDNDKIKMMSKYKTCININRLLNECYIMHLKYCNENSNASVHSIENFMDSTIWKFYDDTDNKYDLVYKNILENPKIILPEELFENEFVVKANNNIARRITKKNTIIENELSLMILEEGATSKIKEIFDTKNEISNDNYKIDIVMVSPPNYKIRIEGNCNNEANKILGILKQKIIDKTNQYSSIIKFGELKTISELAYEIKFLGDVDLDRIELV